MQKIEWSSWNHLIGNVADNQLAHQIGCTSAAVAQQRRKLLGPRFKRHTPIDWTEIDSLIGKISDRDLSSQLNISIETVKARRLRLPPVEKRGWSLADCTLQEHGQQKCFGCEKVKSIKEFYSDRNARRRYCSVCINNSAKLRKLRIKHKWLSELGVCCQSCGYAAHLASLHFHHVGGDKNADPSRLIYNETKIDVVRNELDKCCILCANCYYAFHSEELLLIFVKRDGLGFTTQERL